MKRKLLAGLLLLTLCGPALARTVEDRLISGLRSQGYVIVEDSFTWLGRLRIVAENAQYHREIVVNPETGEVLRDYVVLLVDLHVKPSLPASASTVAASDHDSGLNTFDGTSASVTATTIVGPTITLVPQTGEGLVTKSTSGLITGAAPDDLLLADPVISAGTVTP